MNKRLSLGLYSLAALSLLALPGCGSDDADADTDGKAGSCTITDKGDGTSAIVCPDGTELVVSNGKDGNDGKDGSDGQDGKDAEPKCTLEDNGDGTHSLTCGETSVVIGDSCEQGFPGDVFVVDPVEEPEAAMTLTLFQASGCTHIRGDLVVHESPGEALPLAFARIEQVDGGVYIESNEGLERIAFPSLKTVGGEFYVSNNAELTQVDAPKLVEIEGDFVIEGNDSFVELTGFPALEAVGGWVTIIENPALERTGGFESLTRFGGIQMWENHALVSMADFPALETIEGFGEGVDAGYSLLYIDSHDSLTEIGGFGKLSDIDGNLTIAYNPKLPQCEVEALLDTLTVTGWKDTSGNDETATCP